MSNQAHTLRSASSSHFLDVEYNLDNGQMHAHQHMRFVDPQDTVRVTHIAHTRSSPVITPMTPPATPGNCAKKPEGQKATVSKMRNRRDRRIQRQRTVENEKKKKRQRKFSVAVDPFGSPVKEEDTTSFTAQLLCEPFIQRSGRQSPIQRAPTSMDSQYAIPWFVHYKNLLFSSGDNTSQSDTDTSELRTEDKQSERRPFLAGGKTYCDYRVAHSEPMHVHSLLPEKAAVKNRKEDDDEEAHENRLARLLTNVPPAQVFHPNVTNMNRMSTQAEFDEDRPVLMDDFVTPEALINAIDIDTVNAAYYFFLGLQQEQINLSNRKYILFRKINREKRRSLKLKKKATHKLVHLERANALTENLGSQLFIAEYALRDLVYQNEHNQNFDLSAALDDARARVEHVIDKFDRRIARTRYAPE